MQSDARFEGERLMTPILYSLLLLYQARGVVSDPSGRPIEEAQVTCGSETKFTDSHGSVEFGAPCEASVTKAGFTTGNMTLATGSEGHITLTLAPQSERVVVSATGAAIVLEEAGASADVFTARDFGPQRSPYLADLLRDVPGLDVVQSTSNGGITSLFLRGGNSDAAMVLLDGIPLTEPGGSIDFAHFSAAGMERVEIVRNPASALFGPEASSGVIQLFTRRGTGENARPHASLAYERGSFSTDRWVASLDGMLPQRLDYALTADQIRSTGEFQNNAQRITTGTANLGLRFTDATSLRAIFREFDSYSGNPGQVFYGLTNLDAYESVRDSTAGVRIEDARGARFVQRAMFGYHRKRDWSGDNRIENYQVAALVQQFPDGAVRLVQVVPYSTTQASPGTTLVKSTQTLFPFPTLTLTDRTSASYQGTLTHRGGALVAGYEFERQAGIISATNVDRRNNGLYASEQYAVTSRIYLAGGVRYQHSSTFGDEWAPRGAVTFRLPQAVFFHVSGSRGIKEPALIENFAQEGFYVGNPSLKPAKTDSFEAGLSREWWGRRLRTNAAWFRNSFNDLIVFDFSKRPASWSNIDRSWARGVELSANLRALRLVEVRGEYTRLGTRVVASASGQVGQELLRRPHNAGSFSVQLAPRHLVFLAGARFVGQTHDSDFGVFGVNRNPAYAYAYFSGSWQATRNLQPYFRVDNAADERYQEALGFASWGRSVAGGLRVSF
jgi:outer membrane cobalamin receptor